MGHHEAWRVADRAFKKNGDHQRKSDQHFDRLKQRAGSLLDHRTAYDLQKFVKWRTWELVYIRFQRKVDHPQKWRKHYHARLENNYRLSRTFFKRFYDSCHSMSSYAVDTRSGERWWWNWGHKDDAAKHKKQWEDRSRALAASVSYGSMKFFPERMRVISTKPTVLKTQRITNPSSLTGSQTFLVRTTQGETHSVQKSIGFSVDVTKSVTAGFQTKIPGAGGTSASTTFSVKLGLTAGASWTSGTSSSVTVQHSWTIDVAPCSAVELTANAVDVVVDVPFELIMRIGNTNWSTRGTWTGVASGSAELQVRELPSPCDQPSAKETIASADPSRDSS